MSEPVNPESSIQIQKEVEELLQKHGINKYILIFVNDEETRLGSMGGGGSSRALGVVYNAAMGAIANNSLKIFDSKIGNN